MNKKEIRRWKKLYTLFEIIIVCMIPISIMGFAAFLTCEQVPGWWLYSIIVGLISGSIKYQHKKSI